MILEAVLSPSRAPGLVNVSSIVVMRKHQPSIRSINKLAFWAIAVELGGPCMYHIKDPDKIGVIRGH